MDVADSVRVPDGISRATTILATKNKQISPTPSLLSLQGTMIPSYI
jgi:hypothetical protein